MHLTPSHIGTKGRMIIKLVKAGSWVGNNVMNISCIGVVTDCGVLLQSIGKSVSFGASLLIFATICARAF